MFGSSYKLPIDIVRFSQPEPPKKAKPPTAKTNDDVALITEGFEETGHAIGKCADDIFSGFRCGRGRGKAGVAGMVHFQESVQQKILH